MTEAAGQLSPKNAMFSPKKAKWSGGTKWVFLLFASMFLDAVAFPGLGVPVNAVALGLAVLYGLHVRVKERLRPLWVAPLVLSIPLWLTLASLMNGEPDIRRLFNIALYAAVILVVSAGRLPMAAVGRGLAAAIVIGVAWGALTLPQSAYIGRLTGTFGDPNAAGFLIVVCAAVAMPALRARWHAVVLFLVVAAGVFLTNSRTSMLAVAVMGLWFLLSRYGSPWLGLSAVAALTWWMTTFPPDIFASGRFAERAGSDLLRHRLNEAALADTARNPLFGNGAGTARVDLDGALFFYHNSYLAVRAEAGWIGFVLVVGLLSVVFLGLIRLPRAHRNAWYEAALLGVAVCALTLGEVLLTLPTAVAVGVALRHTALMRAKRTLDTAPGRSPVHPRPDRALRPARTT